MKKPIIPLVLCLLSLALVSCEDPTAARRAAQASSSQDDPVAVARAFVDLLTQGDFAAAEGKFDSEMRAGLPREKLAEVWQTVTAQYGPFRKQVSTQKGKAQGFDIVIVKSEFEKGQLGIRVALNKDKQIAGLFLDPAEN